MSDKFAQDLPGFIQWLETKPADEYYHWPSIKTCVVAQFHDAAGIYFAPVNTTLASGIFCTLDEYHYVGGGFTSAMYEANPDAYDFESAQKLWTFGQALSRAKEVLSKREGMADAHS